MAAGFLDRKGRHLLAYTDMHELSFRVGGSV